MHPMHHTAALFDVAVALTTQGIALADLTPGAFLHYVWQSRDQGLNMKARGKQNRGQFPGQLAWPVLHEMGQFPPASPATVRAAVLTGRRTLEELVDRYDIRHQGVRQLILDYLARRRSELDYSSLDQHARSLAGVFWAKIEALAPGTPTCASTPASTTSGARRSTPARTARASGTRSNASCGQCGPSTPTCTAGRSRNPRSGRRGSRPARSPTTRCAGSPSTSGAPRNASTTGSAAASPCCPPSSPTSRTATTTCASSCSSLAAGRRRGLRPRRPLLPAHLEPADGSAGATAGTPTSGSATSPARRTSTSPWPRSWPSGNGRPSRSCGTAASGSRNCSSSPTSASASTSGLTARSSRCWSSPRPRPTGNASSRCRPSCSPSSRQSSAATPKADGPSRSSSAMTSTNAG